MLTVMFAEQGEKGLESLILKTKAFLPHFSVKTVINSSEGLFLSENFTIELMLSVRQDLFHKIYLMVN